MNVDSILLSEYARIIDGSRLLVVGTFNEVTVPSVPVTLPPFYVTLVFEGHRSERGRTFTVEVKVLNARRESILNEPALFEASFLDADPKPGMNLRHSQVHGMLLTFPEAGPYAFEVYVDGTYYTGTNLFVGVS